MPTPEASGSPTEGTRPRHAGVWVRVGANLIDLIILGIPVLLIVSPILGAEARAEGARVSLADFYNIESLVNAILLTVLTILLWVNWDGRTPGKKVLRLRIVSCPGYEPFRYGTATLRAVLGLTGAATVGLGYVVMAVMIAARDDNRGYHDLIAGTCVVHDP